MGSQVASAAKGGRGKPPPAPQLGQVTYVDADGVIIGDAQVLGSSYEGIQTGFDALVFFQESETVYSATIAPLDGGEVAFRGWLLYDGPNCTGNVYGSPVLYGYGDPRVPPGVEYLQLVGEDGILYVADIDQPRYDLVFQSQWSSKDECLPLGGLTNTYVAVPVIDTNIYARPFRLELFPGN